jgi:hypothetical protein
MSAPHSSFPPHGQRAISEEEQEELINFLERDQLVAGTLVPVPPAALSRRARSALWALRVFVVVVSAMVIYTFVTQLGG